MGNTLSDYLKSIAKYPLLSAEEELDLARRYTVDGDADAFEKMVNCNLRLVVHIAKHYQNVHLSLLDLIGEGNLGLITAVEKYDYTLGNRFSTCAVQWIKQAISKAITDKGRNVRIPAHMYQLMSQYRKALSKRAFIIARLNRRRQPRFNYSGGKIRLHTWKSFLYLRSSMD